MAAKRARTVSDTGRCLTPILMAIVVMLAFPSLAHADIVRGLMRIVDGVFAIPQGALSGTMSGPPILGTVFGTVVGAVRGVAMVTSGALETVISSIPIVEKLAPLIPIFV